MAPGWRCWGRWADKFAFSGECKASCLDAVGAESFGDHLRRGMGLREILVSSEAPAECREEIHDSMRDCFLIDCVKANIDLTIARESWPVSSVAKKAGQELSYEQFDC